MTSWASQPCKNFNEQYQVVCSLYGVAAKKKTMIWSKRSNFNDCNGSVALLLL